MRLILCLISLNLLFACAPTVQPAAPTPSPTPSPSPSPSVNRVSATETEKRLDIFIAAKTKRLAAPLIEALKRYHAQKGSYPDKLDELVPTGLLSKLEADFDVTDFDTPHDPEIERFVYFEGQPRRYRFDYQVEQVGYSLALGYTVLDVIRLEYTSAASDWKEMRVY